MAERETEILDGKFQNSRERQRDRGERVLLRKHGAWVFKERGGKEKKGERRIADCWLFPENRRDVIGRFLGRCIGNSNNYPGFRTEDWQLERE